MSELWGPGRVTPPAVTEPVVVDGTKYRIRSIDEDGTARCRTTFRRRPGVDFDRLTVAVDSLRWDRRAGVWRVA